MEYNVGDRVVIRKDLVVDKHYSNGRVLFVSGMKRFKGKSFIITNKIYDDVLLGHYFYNCDTAIIENVPTITAIHTIPNIIVFPPSSCFFSIVDISST